MNRFLKQSLAFLKAKHDSVVASANDVDEFIDECGQAISDLLPVERGAIDQRTPRYRALSRLSYHVLPRPALYHATDERTVVMVRTVVGSRDGRILLGQYPSGHGLGGKWDVFSRRSEILSTPAQVAEDLLLERYGLVGQLSHAPFFVQRYDISTANELFVDVLELDYYAEMYAPIDPALGDGVGGWRWISESDVMRTSSSLALAQPATTTPLLRVAFQNQRRITALREASRGRISSGMLCDVVVRA